MIYTEDQTQYQAMTFILGTLLMSENEQTRTHRRIKLRNSFYVLCICTVVLYSFVCVHAAFCGVINDNNNNNNNNNNK